MLIEALGIAAHLLAPLPVVEAQVQDTAYMTLGPRVPAPVGYVRFCARRPDQCEGQDPKRATGESSSLKQEASLSAAPALRFVHLSPKAERDLEAVNQAVNDKLVPMSDEAAFGRSNYWTLPIEDEGRAAGNCKHFALEKRAALIASGVPADALSLAVVRTRRGELHAVLIVATDEGDMVLDNLSPRLKTWKATGYRWLARQGPGGPLAWYAVSTGAGTGEAALEIGSPASVAADGQN